MKIRLLALALLAAAAMPGYAQNDLERIQDKVQDFRDQLQAAGTAQASGNTEMAQKHQRNAEQFIAEARTLLEEAGAGETENIELILLYGEVLGLQREYDLAADALRRTTQLAPNNPVLWRYLARALAETGPAYAPKALEALRRALALNPPADFAADIYQIQGHLYIQIGLFDLARQSFEKALEANAATPGAVAGMAALDIRRGKVAEAEARLQSITNMSPELNAQIQPMLADAIRDMGRNRAWFEDSPENHKAYGMLLLQANRLPQSIDPLERAVELNPNDYVAWNLIASAYRGLNNAERARMALQRSLDIEPNQPRTAQMLKALNQANPAAPPPSIAAPPPSIAAPETP